MKNILLTLSAFALASSAQAAHIWINELHYANTGTDVNEFVEVAIFTPNGSGFTATDYRIDFYNGSNGAPYNLTGSTGALNTYSTINNFAATGGTITLYAQTFAGIQNGNPDGLALVNFTNNSVEAFYSYGSTFAAVGGIADGMTSTLLSASESDSTTLATQSIGATGTGKDANVFNASSFALGTATFGQLNAGQNVPEPSTALLGGLAALALLRRRRK